MIEFHCRVCHKEMVTRKRFCSNNCRRNFKLTSEFEAYQNKLSEM